MQYLKSCREAAYRSIDVMLNTARAIVCEWIPHLVLKDNCIWSNAADLSHSLVHIKQEEKEEDFLGDGKS